MNPNIAVIAGSGTPRLILVLATAIYQSAGAGTYTDTTIMEAGNPSFIAAGLRANMRVSSFAVISGQPNKPVFAKITAIDDTAHVVTVDEWIGGTPTTGQLFTVDGYIADLPRAQKLKETFTPDNLVHSVYRRRKSVKRYGFTYQCVIDYSKYIAGDTLLDMKHHLSPGEDDRFILIPRKDSPEFQYNVFHDGPVDLSLFGKTPGHKGPVFTFKGTENVASFPLIDGYGSQYSVLYGTHL